MDFGTDKFEYDFQTYLDITNDLTDFNSEVSVSEIFEMDENGDFVCTGNDIAEYISGFYRKSLESKLLTQDKYL